MVLMSEGAMVMGAGEASMVTLLPLASMAVASNLVLLERSTRSG